MLIRYADDFLCAFQYANDAERFYKVLPKRLEKFNLEVAEDKTSLLRFSRFHPSRKRQFVFLGFAFYWSKDAQGKASSTCRPGADKHRSSMSEFYQFIKAKRSIKLKRWLPELKRKLQGYRNYFGLPDNSRSLDRRLTVNCTVYN